jgi:hypothetical protein
METMCSILDSYQEKHISLRRLVNELEGAFKSLDEDLPQSFYEDWYRLWGKLEEKLAIVADEPNEEDRLSASIMETAKALQSKLKTYLPPIERRAA